MREKFTFLAWASIYGDDRTFLPTNTSWLTDWKWYRWTHYIGGSSVVQVLKRRLWRLKMLLPIALDEATGKSAKKQGLTGVNSWPTPLGEDFRWKRRLKPTCNYRCGLYRFLSWRKAALAIPAARTYWWYIQWLFYSAGITEGKRTLYFFFASNKFGRSIIG